MNGKLIGSLFSGEGLDFDFPQILASGKKERSEG